MQQREHQATGGGGAPLYLGKSVANELSSSSPVGLSSLLNGWMAQCSMPSWSHGLSFLCCGEKVARKHVKAGSMFPVALIELRAIVTSSFRSSVGPVIDNFK